MDTRWLENESLLLLYLSNELPSSDRLELESQLSVDGALRDQLEGMRALQGEFESTVSRIDQLDPVIASPAALRNVRRAMQQWNVDRQLRPVETVAAARKIPVWGWSIGSIAAAVLVFCVWWGFKGDNSIRSMAPGITPGDSRIAISPTTGDDGGALANDPGSPEVGRFNASVALSSDPTSEQLTDLEQAVRVDMRDTFR